MNIEELTKELNIQFDKLSYLLHHQNNLDFNTVFIQGKWTTGQHIAHLIKSMAAVNLLLKAPKFILKYKFGLCNRKEKNFTQLLDKYEHKLLQSKGVAPKRFTSSISKSNDKKKMLESLNKEKVKIISTLNKWSEHDLSKYVLPHPLLGKLSIREMIYFSVFHMDHHRMILKEKYMNGVRI